MTKTRRIDIEVMRIAAAFFVIFNHTEEDGFFLFSVYGNDTLQYWIYMFISVFCKFSVPLFFMISGALLLDRETTSYRRLWKTKVLKTGLVLAFISVLFYLYDVYNGKSEKGLDVFLLKLYSSGWDGSLWYLYTYMAFLLSVPILQKIAKSLSNKEYMYVYLLALLFLAVIPTGQYLIWEGRYTLYSRFNLNWLTSNIFLYPLMGYFLRYRIGENWTKKKVGILWLVNILTIGVSCYLTYRKSIITGELSESASQTFYNTFVLINSTAVFVACQYLLNHRELPGAIKNKVVSVGSATFGIYLLHIFLLDICKEHQFVDFIHNVFCMNFMLSAWICCGCVFVMAYLITILLKKIPWIKYLIS